MKYLAITGKGVLCLLLLYLVYFIGVCAWAMMVSDSSERDINTALEPLKNFSVHLSKAFLQVLACISLVCVVPLTVCGALILLLVYLRWFLRLVEMLFSVIVTILQFIQRVSQNMEGIWVTVLITLFKYWAHLFRTIFRGGHQKV
jgi:hypothetical protein